MDKLRHLKDQVRRGYIGRRNFVKGAVALGMTAAAAVSFARRSEASSHHFTEAKAGFPVLRRDRLADPTLGGHAWDKDNPVDMFNYSVAQLNKAISNATAASQSHHLEDAWLAYACSLAQSESWQFDQAKNPVQHGWQNPSAGSAPTLDAEATALAKNAADALKTANSTMEYEARWALAIVHMNFGRLVRADKKNPDNAIFQYRKVERDLIGQIPAAELVNFKFELADAYVHAGRINDALKLLGRRRGGTPVQPQEDWHWHQLAWCYFVKAGRMTSDAARLGYYQLALQFLRERKKSHDNVSHLALADLLAVACYGSMAVTYDNAGLTEAQDLMETRAERRWRQFRKKNVNGTDVDHENFHRWTIRQAKRYATFSSTRNARQDQEHWAEALNKAKIG